MNLLCVGDFQAVEMTGLPPLAGVLLPMVRSQRFLTNLDDLPTVLHDGTWIPDLVLVAVRHPDEQKEPSVLRALTLLPLARWVVCLSVWCESSLRTGLAWPPAVCVPARMAAARLRAEAAALRGDVAPSPLTASREETVAADLEAWKTLGPASAVGDSDGTRAFEARQTERPRTARVVSPDAALERAVADWLRFAGWKPAGGVRADMLVFDADPLDALLEPGRRACVDSAPRRAVALMTLPTTDAVARLKDVGFDDVVSKLDLSSIARDG